MAKYSYLALITLMIIIIHLHIVVWFHVLLSYCNNFKTHRLDPNMYYHSVVSWSNGNEGRNVHPLTFCAGASPPDAVSVHTEDTVVFCYNALGRYVLNPVKV